MRRNLAFRSVVGGEDDQRVLELADLAELVDQSAEHVVHLHHAVAVHGPRHRLAGPLIRRVVVEVAAARGVIEKEGLLRSLHLVEEGEARIQPVLVELLDVVELDQLAVLAFGLVGRRAMHLVMVEDVVFHHLEALGRERDLGIEVVIPPFGVHVGHAEEADIVVIADILRQRALVLAHMPLAHALGDVALLLEQSGMVIAPSRPPASPYIGGRRMP